MLWHCWWRNRRIWKTRFIRSPLLIRMRIGISHTSAVSIIQSDVSSGYSPSPSSLTQKSISPSLMPKPVTNKLHWPLPSFKVAQIAITFCSKMEELTWMSKLESSLTFRLQLPTKGRISMKNSRNWKRQAFFT